MVAISDATWDVLLVDDDPVSITTIRTVLSDGGLSVRSAQSGAEALQLLDRIRPRLILLDVGMPRLDGLTLCALLRANPALHDTPILFLSSARSSSTRIAGLRSGAMDFITKSCDPCELVERVRTHLAAADRHACLHKANDQLASANQRLTAGVEAAGLVQNAMWAARPFADARLHVASRTVPCAQMAGDVVSVVPLSKSMLAVSVLDASGHGAPAAVVAIAAASLLMAFTAGQSGRILVDSVISPAELLSETNDLMLACVPDGVFVSAILGIIDLERGRLVYSTAGHPGPLLCRGSATPSCLDHPALPLGIESGEYDDVAVDLLPGDRVLLYSDGVYEQRSPDREQWGRARLLQALAVRSGAGVEVDIDQLLARLAAWGGTREQDDDVSLVLIDYSGQHSQNTCSDLTA